MHKTLLISNLSLSNHNVHLGEDRNDEQVVDELVNTELLPFFQSLETSKNSEYRSASVSPVAHDSSKLHKPTNTRTPQPTILWISQDGRPSAEDRQLYFSANL